VVPRRPQERKAAPRSRLAHQRRAELGSPPGGPPHRFTGARPRERVCIEIDEAVLADGEIEGVQMAGPMHARELERFDRSRSDALVLILAAGQPQARASGIQALRALGMTPRRPVQIEARIVDDGDAVRGHLVERAPFPVGPASRERG